MLYGLPTQTREPSVLHFLFTSLSLSHSLSHTHTLACSLTRSPAGTTHTWPGIRRSSTTVVVAVVVVVVVVVGASERNLATIISLSVQLHRDFQGYYETRKNLEVRRLWHFHRGDGGVGVGGVVLVVSVSVVVVVVAEVLTKYRRISL